MLGLSRFRETHEKWKAMYERKNKNGHSYVFLATINNSEIISAPWDIHAEIPFYESLEKQAPNTIKRYRFSAYKFDGAQKHVFFPRRVCMLLRRLFIFYLPHWNTEVSLFGRGGLLGDSPSKFLSPNREFVMAATGKRFNSYCLHLLKMSCYIVMARWWISDFLIHFPDGTFFPIDLNNFYL